LNIVFLANILKLSKMFNPKISIILPNYNSQKTLKDTVKSVIEQTYQNWEIIIIDDSSNTETKNILSEYEKDKRFIIKYLNKNKGTAFCRNLALRSCVGEYVAFLDSDDIWSKEKLEKQINFMNENNYSFTYTYYSTFKSQNNKKIINIIKPPSSFNFDSFTKDTSISTSTMIVKKHFAKKFKFTNTQICEDYFYKCLLLKEIKFAHCLKEFLTLYKIRNHSLQSKKLRNLYWIWKINQNYNKFNLLRNFVSLFCISINSLKKYGFK